MFCWKIRSNCMSERIIGFSVGEEKSSIKLLKKNYPALFVNIA